MPWFGTIICTYSCHNIIVCTVLNMPDTVYWFFYYSRMDFGEEPQVKVAANIFRELCYQNRDNVSAGILVAGWDKVNGGQVRFIGKRCYINWYL